MKSSHDGPRPERTQPLLARPLLTVLLLAISLKLLYTGIAAIAAPQLAIDPALVRSNQLTESLMPQSGSAAYRFSGIWQRFDTLWYVHIAEHGYDRPAAVVFYPLYPFLIRLLSPLMGSIQAALAISFAASVLLFWALFRLAEFEFDGQAAWRAIAVLAVWPASFILFAGYPDSLVLALTVSSLYWALTGKTSLSSSAAFLGALTKAAGLAVAVPLIVFAVARKSWRMALPAGAAAAGFVSYASYLSLAGLPSPSEVYPQEWRTSIVPPWRTVLEVSRRIGSDADLLLVYNVAMLALVLLLCLWKPRPAAYLAFALALVMLLLLKRTDPLLQSTSRYLVAVFPAYLNLARSRVALALVLPLAALNVWLMLLYFKWWLVV